MKRPSALLCLTILSIVSAQNLLSSTKATFTLNNENITQTTQNFQGTTLLLFTGTPVFYFANLTHLPTTASQATSNILRFNTSQLNGTIPSTEQITGGYVLSTAGSPDVWYLFGLTNLYEITPMGPVSTPTVNAYASNSGLGLAREGTVRNRTLYIPTGPGFGSTAQVNTFDLTAKTFGSALATGNTAGSTSAHYRASDDTFVFLYLNGVLNGGSVDVIDGATFNNIGTLIIPVTAVVPKDNTTQIIQSNNGVVQSYSLSRVDVADVYSSQNKQVQFLPALAPGANGFTFSNTIVFYNPRSADVALVVTGGSPLAVFQPARYTARGLQIANPASLDTTSPTVVGAVLSVNATSNLYFTQNTVYVADSIGCIGNCSYPQGSCASYNYYDPGYGCNCASGFTGGYCEHVAPTTSTTSSTSPSSTNNSGTAATTTAPTGSATSVFASVFVIAVILALGL
ncbi:hypothetical protein PROFUN_09578 [Planoprotostelium fungivorum]|uniref:EGF-like domain-containing protein n=1 Tax=Planoprotostelium fungivorum TaxID=1890364 RepID=A0A2P6NGS1_9EUKA|nr:hypothetical protein PROFUN_09578 [Planoprotostelium fungivorum]